MAFARPEQLPIFKQDDDFHLHFIDGLSAVARLNLDRWREGFSLISLPGSHSPAVRSSVAMAVPSKRSLEVERETEVMPAVIAVDPRKAVVHVSPHSMKRSNRAPELLTA